jgi:hypothetical protein
MVFSTRFFNKKIPKSDRRKKYHLLIKTSRFGHVLCDWVVKLDLVNLNGKVIYKMTDYLTDR